MGILNVDLNNINLDHIMKMTMKLLFMSDFRLGIVNLKNAKHLKRVKQRINAFVAFVAWHPRRWSNFCMSEDEKKEIEPIFTE